LIIKSQQDQRGFSVTEVLLAATIFGLITTGLIGAVVYGRVSTAAAGDRARAAQLAEGGIEATRNIGRAAFANLVDGTYGLTQSGSPLAWAFSGTSDVTDIYTRQVIISTPSTDRKTITCTVTWPQPNGATGTVTLTGQLDNWSAAIKLWSNGVVAGGYDATGTTDGFRVFASGNYAYLVRNVTGATNFFIIDISNQAAPTLTGSLTLANTPTDVFVSGTNAYVSNSAITGELQIVNVSNPAAPSLTSTFNAPGTAGGGLSVFVSGNYAYLGRSANTTNAELTIVNISNPAVPTQAGIYSNNVAMNKIVVVPGATTYAYIVTNSTTAELLTVNVTNPAAPALTNSFNTTPAVAATGLAIAGSTAFVAAGTNLTAVNIATPAAPSQTSTIATLAGTASGIDVDTTLNFLFVGTAGTAAEMQVYNIASPASMTLVKSIDVAGTASTVNEVSYDTALDVIVAASASDTQELVIGKRN